MAPHLSEEGEGPLARGRPSAGPASAPAGMTRRQAQFLAFILRYTRRRGIAPSFEEMASHFGISSPSVHGMIKTLERKGFISRVAGAARTLRVEVPPEVLPDIDFGQPAPRGGAATRSAPPASAAVSAAIAILDAVMPRLVEHGTTVEEVAQVVLESSERIREDLVRAGLPPDEALAAARQVAAETPRWLPGGRGVSVRRRSWGRS